MPGAEILHTISGADKFQLLLDRHIRAGKQEPGNVIRLSIEVKGKIDIQKFSQSVRENSLLTNINSLQVENGFLCIPKWKHGSTKNTIAITEHIVDEDGIIPETVLTRDIRVNSGNLIHIDIVHGKITSKVVVSAHHALTDNQGIQALVKLISGRVTQQYLVFTKEKNERISLIQQLRHTLKATRLVFNKTPKKLAKLVSGDQQANYSILRFSREETALIEEQAVKNGASLSKSSFYLAATAMALKQTIFSGRDEVFFLPVPQNQRLRGGEQFAVGNQLSFLFYTIPFNKLSATSEATAFITAQMMEQAKKQLPASYAYLLKTFRFLPLNIYDLFFKMPTKGAVCSFLFSDLGETLPEMNIFAGMPVTEVLNFPPCPCPPHLTFVVMKHAGALKLITAYNSKVVSEEQIADFETTLISLLN